MSTDTMMLMVLGLGCLAMWLMTSDDVLPSEQEGEHADKEKDD